EPIRGRKPDPDGEAKERTRRLGAPWLQVRVGWSPPGRESARARPSGSDAVGEDPKAAEPRSRSVLAPRCRRRSAETRQSAFDGLCVGIHAKESARSARGPLVPRPPRTSQRAATARDRAHARSANEQYEPDSAVRGLWQEALVPWRRADRKLELCV